jgi:hypothetical protein
MQNNEEAGYYSRLFLYLALLNAAVDFRGVLQEPPRLLLRGLRQALSPAGVLLGFIIKQYDALTELYTFNTNTYKVR